MFGCSVSSLHERRCACKENTYIYLIFLLILFKNLTLRVFPILNVFWGIYFQNFYL